MLEGGDDPLYVARRLIRMASEDVGLANPQALGIAMSAFQATQVVGMPECDVRFLVFNPTFRISSLEDETIDTYRHSRRAISHTVYPRSSSRHAR